MAARIEVRQHFANSVNGCGPSSAVSRAPSVGAGSSGTAHDHLLVCDVDLDVHLQLPHLRQRPARSEVAALHTILVATGTLRLSHRQSLRTP